MPYRGTLDLSIWKIWSYAGATNPLGYIYRLQGDERPPLTLAYINRAFTNQTSPAKWIYGDRGDYVDYPPVTPLLFGLIGRAYIAFSPDFDDAPTLNFLLKLPALLADIGATLLIFFAARRLYTARFALSAAALYWLNPLAILAGPLLGYTDPVYAVWLIASVLLFSKGKHAWGWVLYTLALLTKPQPLAAAPLLLLASAARRSFARIAGYLAAALTTVFTMLIPFLISSTVINLIANNLRVARQPYLSANNANLWWLATYAMQVHDLTNKGVPISQALRVTPTIANMPDMVAAGLSDPRPWALAFFAIFTVVVAWAWWRRVGRSADARAGRTPLIAEAAALQIYGGTLLLTQVHENHAYGAVALLGVAWWLQRRPDGKPDRELLALYAALSTIVFFNLLIFYGLGEDLGQNIIRRNLLGIDLSVLLTVFNLAVFGWWLYRFLPARQIRLHMSLH